MMMKTLMLPLTILSLAALMGCTNVDSIPSDDMYTVVSEKKMPEYCRRAVAKELGIYRQDIFIFPVEFKKGSKVVYGKYSVSKDHLKEFVCVFNADDTFAGIKMRHTDLPNELCYD